MTLSWSPRAAVDLEAIAAYLVERSPQGATAVAEDIRRTIELIRAYPGAGRALEQRPSVQVLPLGRFPYLVFYTTLPGETVILHIRHAARKPITPETL